MKTQLIISINGFEVGEYVFVSRFSDASPYDPWAVGNIDEIGKDHKGGFIRMYETGTRIWRYAKKITKKQGDKILIQYPNQC